MGKRIPNKTKKGRQSKVPNLKRLDSGNFLNMYGVEITPDERKRLKNLVDSVNRKRKKQLELESEIITGGDSNSQLHLMGRESDFILAHRSKSVQRFRTRKQFDNYLASLERVNSKNYMDERVKMYKRNYMKALDNAFGSEGKDIKMKIRMMKPKDYMRLVQGNEDLEFGYLYTLEEVHIKLNVIRSALGMKVKDLPY